MTKNIIVYPFLLETLQHCTDVFWEYIFENLVYGKSPYGTYISKDSLCCNYTDKEFSYKLEAKESRLLYNELYNIFTNIMCIYSTDERLKNRNNFFRLEESLNDVKKTWVSIRKKNIKDLMIEKFAIDMKKEYNLTIKQVKYLISMIMVGLNFKIITSKDIDYSSNRINSIKGISFEENNIIFKDTFFDIKSSLGPEIILEDRKRMDDNWYKYLKFITRNNTSTSV